MNYMALLHHLDPDSINDGETNLNEKLKLLKSRFSIN